MLGDDNVILAYSHIAHDCVIGNHLVMSSQSALAGHVVVEDHVNVGWGTGVHQFCRVGAYAMLGAMSKVVQDVPPFFIADGNPAVIRSLNKVGLGARRLHRRSRSSASSRSTASCFARASTAGRRIERLQKHPQAASEEFQRVLAFAAASERGFMPGR